jgi:NTP pyrophosphatase (non-canonical NTP hydrolase)
MNFSELQAELRHFAAERDWQPFHTPKNLSTALLVEAAELAEIFQWMTPEESQAAKHDPVAKGRIADEVADVLLYLLQLADNCSIDIARAATEKLERNALKYPATRAIARVSPMRAALPGVHVLLDYENVQPSEAALRALVPDASQVWVFHGPHQRQVGQRFAGFGDAATAVPISKTGKNALDFHLSFYMGYIASRNPAASLVVVANDKGYEPMLAHAQAMGFTVRQEGHGKAKQDAPAKAKAKAKAASSTAAKAAAKKAAPKKAAAKKAPAKKAAAKNAPPPAAPAGKALAKKAAPAAKASTAKKVAAKTSATTADKPGSPKSKSSALKSPAPASAAAEQLKAATDDVATIKRLTDSLRNMGDKRPTKPQSLWRSIKSFLGGAATEDEVEHALARLMSDNVVKVDTLTGVSYPQFTVPANATPSA